MYTKSLSNISINYSIQKVFNNQPSQKEHSRHNGYILLNQAFGKIVEIDEKKKRPFICCIHKSHTRHVIFWGGHFKNTSRLIPFSCSIVVIQSQKFVFKK